MDDLVVIGGGAGGFFGAIACAEASPGARVRILEKTNSYLGKVRISGGGRCNTTHHLFDARELAKRYPRGSRALMGPFTRFGPAETIAWFKRHGVELKTEQDGRMFPVTDRSDTIIECLLNATSRAGVTVQCGASVTELTRRDNGFELKLEKGETLSTRFVLLATGGSRTPGGADLAGRLGHQLAPPVPSLFSFDGKSWLQDLPGVAVSDAEASVPSFGQSARGPVLITHRGVSGPAILKLSAWCAREMSEAAYQFALKINWIPGQTETSIQQTLSAQREKCPTRRVHTLPLFGLPARLWEAICHQAIIYETVQWTRLARHQAASLTELLRKTEIPVTGKSLNKDEFVTCGGIKLRDVDMKTMESRICPGLYFAGEVLDIDGITGGFNFQAAWTTGWHAGNAIAARLQPKSSAV